MCFGTVKPKGSLDEVRERIDALSPQAKATKPVAPVTPPQTFTTYQSTSDGTPLSDSFAPAAPSTPTTNVMGMQVPSQGRIGRTDNNAIADKAIRASRQSSMRVIR